MNSEAIEVAIKQRLNSLTKPVGSLGKLEEIVIALGIAQQKIYPDISQRKCLIFAGDHGVTAEGVSAYPSEVTRQMLLNFAQGGAAVNVLTKSSGTILEIVDVGVIGEAVPGVSSRRIRSGTHNFLKQPAMEISELEKAMEVGASFVDQNFSLFILGEMGIGNTAASAAIAAAIIGCAPSEVTGSGTGLDPINLKNKIAVIEQALLKYRDQPQSPQEILARFAGFEIAAIVGFILESGKQNIPVLIDGYIVTTAALVALEINPAIKRSLIIAHRSSEYGHKKILEYLKVEPLLDLQMRLGEGSGALVALPILDNALRLYHEMATFESAQISQNN